MATTRRVGKYELGRTVGEGNFAKVKFAINTETGESVAVKILAKTTILKHRMVDQIRREISIMKIVRHPFIVRLHEVLASKTKIYIILEFVPGGELFDKIVHKGKLSEMESRKYFQQLVDAISHCHKKGVYHRDLKPENLLLDAREDLKVSDFGLSALPQKGVNLLHTTCGTPNYVAPEVLNGQGYDGAAADIWSCGVVLYVLLAGYLPFEETDLPSLYKKINSATFSCPFWFSPGAKSLIEKMLDPNPNTRISIEEIRNDPWFPMNYIPARQGVEEEVNLDDICAAFNDIEDHFVTEQTRHLERGPMIMNAFEMITLSQGLNLSALFDRRQDYVKRQTRFVSKESPKTIISTIETVAESMGLKVHTRNYKTRLEGISANKVYEVAPSLFMVDVRGAAGDTLEYHKFYKFFCAKLDHIIWKPNDGIIKDGSQSVENKFHRRSYSKP
ncbi:CBL-interacting serine/threonine-protein kinase 24-like isoform X2 [Chenopodium quinoa]|uniref:CBL-interacting serine/threonine-protein kinase 24-like isoform X2 n=1 Tax=Chenopodium quinoa TaxID=63459 RepID=UPI000B787336|nr:CBL-interacting serine/threonine-protein kinase 24-like isoform X2 [Chenopodium quinoa]